MADGISLIVGLGNPGPEYQQHRHNAGARFVDAVCRAYQGDLRPDSKLLGLVGRVTISGHDLRLLFPTTYMNRSGQSVAAICQYFKIAPANVLVAYDELDLPAGTVRLKHGGGHGGHNGVRDIIKALGTADFHRLRIGIGHPGSAREVHDYVLGNPSRQDSELMDNAMARALQQLPLLCSGQFQQAMLTLHTKQDNTPHGH